MVICFTDWACICFHECLKKGMIVASKMPKITHLYFSFTGLCKVQLFTLHQLTTVSKFVLLGRSLGDCYFTPIVVDGYEK